MDTSIDNEFHGHFIDDDTQSLIIISDLYIYNCFQAPSQVTVKLIIHNDDKVGYKKSYNYFLHYM